MPKSASTVFLGHAATSGLLKVKKHVQSAARSERRSKAHKILFEGN